MHGGGQCPLPSPSQGKVGAGVAPRVWGCGELPRREGRPQPHCGALCLQVHWGASHHQHGCHRGQAAVWLQPREELHGGGERPLGTPSAALGHPPWELALAGTPTEQPLLSLSCVPPAEEAEAGEEGGGSA